MGKFTLDTLTTWSCIMWNKPYTSLTIPIIFYLARSCMKQYPAIRIRLQGMSRAFLLVENELWIMFSTSLFFSHIVSVQEVYPYLHTMNHGHLICHKVKRTKENRMNHMSGYKAIQWSKTNTHYYTLSNRICLGVSSGL